MAESIWPHDTYLDPYVSPRPLGELTCFVLSPFQPRGRFDTVFGVIQEVCRHLKTPLQLRRFECVRADAITSAGVIQPEIWRHIKNADLIIADVSGQNGNVMLELGVAAAWRKKEHVIIIREANPTERHLFDMNPARHIEYDATPEGYNKLGQQLAQAVLEAIVSSPLEEIPEEDLKLPLVAPLQSGQDCPSLWVPSIAHRRMLRDCLEFGSFYVFSNSWLAVGNLRIRNVRVRAELRFTERRETEHKCWMGIMLRAQSHWANEAHLSLLRSDGSIARTARRSEDPQTHHDVELGKLSPYDPDQFVQFEVSFDDRGWEIKVGSFETFVSVDAMPFVFSTGRVLFQTYQCRVGVRNLSVEAL